MVTNSSQISPHDLRRIAVAACCDPRTVAQRLAGGRQHSTIVARIDQAMRDLGFEPPPAPPSSKKTKPSR